MPVRYDPATRAQRGPQPGLILLRDYIVGRWGGEDLGIYNNRTVRGGSTLSLHAEGRAFDWRAPSRATLEELFGWLARHADALNVQAFHDYERGQRWLTGRGWYPARIGAGAGGPTTHIERNWDGARDQRPIDLIVPEVTPMYSPPLTLEPIVAELVPPDGQGVWLLAPSGAIYAFGGARGVRGANGRTWFTGRTAARLEPPPAGSGKLLTIVATSGERYHLPDPTP